MSCCFWFSQPDMETTRNENGSRPARIRRDYHATASLFGYRRHESNFWTLRGRRKVFIEKKCTHLTAIWHFPFTSFTIPPTYARSRQQRNAIRATWLDIDNHVVV